MTIAHVEKFTFDEEFGSDRRTGPSRRAADQQRLDEAEQQGYARGVLDGRREAEAEAAMRTAHAMEQVAEEASRLFGVLDQQTRFFEREAAALALAFARKLAGDLVDQQPLQPLTDAASECFRHLIGTPHAVATVPEEHLDRAKTMLDRLAAERGFAGRLVVLGDPEMAQGDFRLEWADGGLARDAATLEKLMSASIARHCGGGHGADLDQE